MKFWFDTEFFEDGRIIDLISIGVVAEDGREYYAETDRARRRCSSNWLRTNVLPHLQGRGKTRHVISGDIIDFMGPSPEIWAYYADYDWIVLCQLYGCMIDLPASWPMYCRDVKQLADSLGGLKLPKQQTTEHHALADARWTKEAWEFCNTHAALAQDWHPIDDLEHPTPRDGTQCWFSYDGGLGVDCVAIGGFLEKSWLNGGCDCWVIQGGRAIYPKMWMPYRRPAPPHSTSNGE